MTSYLSPSSFPLCSGNVISSHKRLWKCPIVNSISTYPHFFQNLPKMFFVEFITKGNKNARGNLLLKINLHFIGTSFVKSKNIKYKKNNQMGINKWKSLIFFLSNLGHFKLCVNRIKYSNLGILVKFLFLYTF